MSYMYARCVTEDYVDILKQFKAQAQLLILPSNSS